MIPELNRIYLGDCVETMRSWPDACVDSVVTDPPYELGFMGKSWDSTGIAYSVPMWSEVLRVMKPGAHLLAFSATRTYHRMACAIEDAGFEIRDQVQWLYGSGFPKSLDVSKAIDKFDATSGRRLRDLKFTAWVRECGLTAAQINAATGTLMGSHYTTDKEQPSVATAEMFDKLRPLLPAVPEWVEKMVVERTIESENFKNRQTVGSRVMADTTKVRAGFTGRAHSGDASGATREVNITTAFTDEAKSWQGWGTALKPANEPIVLARKPLSEGTVAANVLKWGTGALNIDGSRIACEAGDKPDFPSGDYTTDTTVGSIRAEARTADSTPTGRWPANILFDHYASGVLDAQESGASRFFYVAKPDGGERNAGLGDRISGGEATDREDGSAGLRSPRAGAGAGAGAGRTGGNSNFHPTVKPVDLMAYLIRLVTPPGGIVLDPFLGSGTTAIAAEKLMTKWLGCEMSAEYVALAEKRIAAETRQGKLL